MERKGPRGSKLKNVPPRDLFALGNKNIPSGSGLRSLQESQSGQLDKSYGSKSSGSGKDRYREGFSSSAIGIAKKPVPRRPFLGASNLSKTIQKMPANEVVEEWELVAEDVELENLIPFLEAAEDRDDFDRIESYLCGTIKTLKSQRLKPDNVLCLTLLYLSRIKPHLYSSSPLIIEGFCSLLKKSDHTLMFKAKNNMPLSVLVVNILQAVFRDEKNWPEIFIRVFIEDSMSDRVWVDNDECKGFVNNILASFQTKGTGKITFSPDLGMSNRQECPSPPIMSGSSMELLRSEDGMSLECKETLDASVMNRYQNITSEIEEMILEAVQNQFNMRHHNVEVITRSFLQFLTTVCGILDVRALVTPKLEMWLQNPKHQKLATELLMRICMNCNTFSSVDQRIMGQIVPLRLKQNKPLTNCYMSCLRELLKAHKDNIACVIKESIFNELSPTRNITNMQILTICFQYNPDYSANVLAEVFIELLRNSDDFLRALRGLLREILRSLRYDMNFQTFCQGLMKDQKDSAFRDTFEFKERMFYSIIDLIVLTKFLSVSPQLKDVSAQISRGDTRDNDILLRHQEMISSIQCASIHWLLRRAPKYYQPSKEDYIKALHKVLMLGPQEVYYHIDGWPSETDRPILLRLVCEVPVKQEMVLRLLMISSMKEQYVKPQELAELVDKLIRRASALSQDKENMIMLDDLNIIDLIFGLCPYIPPENSQLPSGYHPPTFAISNLYWKAWTVLLLVTAHNLTVFGILAWDSYPTLRVMMEMCITNSFTFPPPTMSVGERENEMNNQELILCGRERQQILEFESHLAQKTITEQNSYMISQLITMEPKGPARKPPLIILDQLKALNATNKIGHLLCRCRKPDFLLDIIQRQGTPQSMPWLAQLVQSNEDAFSSLPVQCLCEFLLSEIVSTSDYIIVATQRRLLSHLRSLLCSPQGIENGSVEIMECFLRRLSFPHPEARVQALRGLKLIISSTVDAPELSGVDSFAWLLHHVPSIPSFPFIRSVACHALRAACQIETQPAAVSAYIRFLAAHTQEDTIDEMGALVQDMAQLIVERSTMISAILPTAEQCSRNFPHAKVTLNSFFLIFIQYMHKVRIGSSDLFSWSENQDHVRVQWASGEQAVMHILVVHAMVILLIYGPCASNDLFSELLKIWFPHDQDMPQAFLVDTAQEALLLPDWLKLKMIRSSVPQLVDAALRDLEPSQLVLFIQSFGIPVASMTKLLCALDLAVRTNKDAVAAAVLDKSHKTYMAQLVEVQHQRGARGGRAFAATLGEREDTEMNSETPQKVDSLITPLIAIQTRNVDVSVCNLQLFLLQCFTSRVNDKQSKLRALHQLINKEINDTNGEKLYINELKKSLSAIINSCDASNFVQGLHTYSNSSSPLFRTLLRIKKEQELQETYAVLRKIVSEIIRLSGNISSILMPILASFDTIDSPMDVDESSQTFFDFLSPSHVLEKLTTASLMNLEKTIRDLAERAIKEGKVSIVVQAISNLLVTIFKKKIQDQTDSPHNNSFPLLIDWLQVLDPELTSVYWEFRKFILFGSELENSKTVSSQTYVLAAYIHQVNWSTLAESMQKLLDQFDPTLNSSTVLNFIWSVIRVPKLWQGRERRTPKYAKPNSFLQLTQSNIDNISKYVLKELQYSDNIKEERIDLLLYFLSEKNEDMTSLLRTIDTEESDEFFTTKSQLLYKIYLRRPRIIRHLSDESTTCLTRTQAIMYSETHSRADLSLHALITMLTSPIPGKDFVRRMRDLEGSLRKLASLHPLLLLRHLSLLASTIQGKCHLRVNVLYTRNYPEVFEMVLGILELLHPYIFLPKYSTILAKLLDAYIEFYSEHGPVREFSPMLNRFCEFILKWVSAGGVIAASYVNKNSSLFLSLLNFHNYMSLRSLAAISVSRNADHITEEKDLFESFDISDLGNSSEKSLESPWSLCPMRDITELMKKYKTNEEQKDVLRRLLDFSDNYLTKLLPRCIGFLSRSILNTSRDIRLKSWILVSRFLKLRPQMSSDIAECVLIALNSEDLTVAGSAVEHLPEVIIYLHEFASDLLTSAFNVCLLSDSSTTESLSEALFLLTVSTGA